MTDPQLIERVTNMESYQAELAKTLAVLTQKMEGIEEKFTTAINFLTEKNDILLTNLTDRLEKSAEIDEKLISRLDQMGEMFHRTEIRLTKTEEFVEKRQRIASWGKKALISVVIAAVGAALPKLFTLIYLLFM